MCCVCRIGAGLGLEWDRAADVLRCPGSLFSSDLLDRVAAALLRPRPEVFCSEAWVRPAFFTRKFSVGLEARENAMRVLASVSVEMMTTLKPNRNYECAIEYLVSPLAGFLLHQLCQRICCSFAG